MNSKLLDQNISMPQDKIEAENDDIEKNSEEIEMITCSICYEDVEKTKVKFLKCGHIFCTECFSDYFESLIQEQNKHNSLRCP